MTLWHNREERRHDGDGRAATSPASRWAIERLLCSKFIHGEIFSPGDRYLRLTGRESRHRHKSTCKVTGGEGGGAEYGIFLQTLYHQDPHESVWQNIFRGDLLQNSCRNSTIHLYQSCSSINQLQFDYRDLAHLLTPLSLNQVQSLWELTADQYQADSII